MYELLEKVLKPYGPSGNEEAVAQTIRQALEGHVDSIETDVMGNLIAIKKGTNPNGKKVMFSAHMDHIGFIVTGFEKEGFLRVTNVGGVSPDSNQFRHVTFGNGVQGVVVSQPLKPGENRAMKHLFIDVGAQDRAEAEKMVKLGDVAVYAPNVVRLGQYRVASPAMDDRSACAVLLQFLLQAGTYADTIIGVFSVQEEVGCRGAKTASFALAPDVGIALDVTAWGDTPEVDQPAVALGKGIAVKVMDRASISNPPCGISSWAWRRRRTSPTSVRCWPLAAPTPGACRLPGAAFPSARCPSPAAMCTPPWRPWICGTWKPACS